MNLFLPKPENRYTKLARYYDAIYHNIIDYEKRTSYLERIIKKFHKGRIKSILDIACGTGNFTFLFAQRGYKVTGIDLSKDMIRVARGKRRASKDNPEFFEMDMCDVHLNKKYDAATTMFGGFGYLLSYNDVREFLAGVKRSLNKNGLLIFEFWHVSAVRPDSSSKNGFTTFVKARDRDKLIIRLDTNKFDPSTDICDITFDTFVISTKTRRLLDTFSERHLLKTYTISEMTNLLQESGFMVLGFYEDTLGSSGKIESARQSSFRVLTVATPKILS